MMESGGGGVSNGHATDTQPMGRAGGRIKRFCDVEAQTEPVVWPAQKPTMVETGCGPDDETVAVKEPSAKGFVPAMSPTAASRNSPSFIWQKQMEPAAAARATQQGFDANFLYCFLFEFYIYFAQFTLNCV